MTDNSAALARARRQDSQTKRSRAERALSTMLEAGDPVTFAGVARRAGVSLSLLYADKDLAARVAEARNRQRRLRPDRAWRRMPVLSSGAEPGSRRHLVAAGNSTDPIGAVADSQGGWLAPRDSGETTESHRQAFIAATGEMMPGRSDGTEVENAALRRRVSGLEAEIRQLSESLDAIRKATRDLIVLLDR